MNLRLAPVYICKYKQRGPVVESGPDTAARGQERETERGGDEERKRERERRQGRCLDNSCKVQLVRMPANAGERGREKERCRRDRCSERTREREKEKKNERYTKRMEEG